MSRKVQSVASYTQWVDWLLQNYPEEEAISRAVGGDWEDIGVYEHALLRQHGLRPRDSVVDVGCGSGRLANQLRRYPGLTYLGTDAVPALVEYARRKLDRPGFRFEPVADNRIPAPDASADMVVFFSVITHLLHEESYAYLAEAHRVLRPGGRVVLSFLEFAVPVNWPIFANCVDWARSDQPAGHLNVFLHRDDLRIWAGRLGFIEQAMRYGDEPMVVVDAELATARVPEGVYPLGQSLAVLRKPFVGEDVPPPAVMRRG